MKATFDAKSLDLNKLLVLIAPRGAQANVVFFGGTEACYADVVFVTALEIPNNILALRLGEL